MSNLEVTAFTIVTIAGMAAVLLGKMKAAQIIGGIAGIMWLVHFWVTR